MAHLQPPTEDQYVKAQTRVLRIAMLVITSITSSIVVISLYVGIHVKPDETTLDIGGLIVGVSLVVCIILIVILNHAMMKKELKAKNNYEKFIVKYYLR